MIVEGFTVAAVVGWGVGLWKSIETRKLRKELDHFKKPIFRPFIPRLQGHENNEVIQLDIEGGVQALMTKYNNFKYLEVTYFDPSDHDHGEIVILIALPGQPTPQNRSNVVSKAIINGRREWIEKNGLIGGIGNSLPELLKNTIADKADDRSKLNIFEVQLFDWEGKVKTETDIFKWRLQDKAVDADISGLDYEEKCYAKKIVLCCFSELRRQFVEHDGPMALYQHQDIKEFIELRIADERKIAKALTAMCDTAAKWRKN